MDILTQTSAISNTAPNSQTKPAHVMNARIDWISLKFEVQGDRKLNKLIECLQDWLDVEIFFNKYRIDDDYTGRYKTYGGSLGCTFSYSHFDDNDNCRARVTLPGEYLANRKPWQVKKNMRKLSQQFGAICTRIDLAVDDYEKQLDHKLIIEATKQKQGIGFNSGKTIDSYGTDNDGITVYCGSRRSPKYARFYQKGDYDRFEVEYKQRLAAEIFREYVACPTATSLYYLSSTLRSSISFAVKPDRNLSRAKELDWWIAFRDRIFGEYCKVRAPKPRPSLDRTLKWIHRSVSKSLLLMREALGIKDAEKLLQLWLYEAQLRCDEADSDRLKQFIAQKLSLDELMLVL